jgi:putative ABC transport system ATP-binding protein
MRAVPTRVGTGRRTSSEVAGPDASVLFRLGPGEHADADLVGRADAAGADRAREGGPTIAGEDEPPALIDLAGVARRYRLGEVTVTALEDVDLRIGEGEFVVVLGPSGSGKTTLLNLVGALDTPTSGRITVAGTDITRASRRELAAFRRRSVSFIFQTFNLFPGLSALENVSFGVDVSGRERDSERVAAAVLRQVGLGDRTTHSPHELSGGEQQRVAIARALATRNPILLADEPTGELDFRTGVQILQLLHEQTHAAGTAVIVVTHNREIARVADRVVELSSGRVVSDAPNPGGPAEFTELIW